MKIESLLDLKKLIKLCRQTGIEAIEVDNIKMNLGPTSTIVKTTKAKPISSTIPLTSTITEEMIIPTNGLTEEQLLYYSVGNEQQ